MNNEAMMEAGVMSIYVKGIYTTVVALFASMTAYLNINTEALAIYFALLAIDLLTGVLASFIAKEGVTLVRFYAGIFTKSLMFIIPIVVALIVKLQGEDLLWFIKWTVIVLAVSEGVSIFNNVLKAKGKEPLPEFDAILIISGKLRDVLERIFKTANGEKKE